MTCATCLHFHPDPDTASLGSCRCKSPSVAFTMEPDEAGQPTVSASSVWPPVTPDDGCGEWKAKGDIPAVVSPSAGRWLTSETPNIKGSQHGIA